MLEPGLGSPEKLEHSERRNSHVAAASLTGFFDNSNRQKQKSVSEEWFTWGSSRAGSRAEHGPGRSPGSEWRLAHYWSPGWWCWRAPRSCWSRPGPRRRGCGPSGRAATSGTARQTCERRPAARQTRSWEDDDSSQFVFTYNFVDVA